MKVKNGGVMQPAAAFVDGKLDLETDLIFDPVCHIYKLATGEALPSVTQILEASGVIDYSALPNNTRNMALQRGSFVHEAIHLDMQGELDWDTLDPILLPYVEAAAKFRNEFEVNGGLMEHRSFHPVYRYAGTLDYQPKKLLVDWKCGGAQPWVRMQTAAYAALLPDPGSYRRIAVGLFPDGHYDATKEFRCADWFNDFNDFLCCLRVAQLQKEGK